MDNFQVQIIGTNFFPRHFVCGWSETEQAGSPSLLIQSRCARATCTRQHAKFRRQRNRRDVDGGGNESQQLINIAGVASGSLCQGSDTSV